MIEAISVCEQLTGRPFNYIYSDDNRTGDHIWWISDLSKFKNHYPTWSMEYDSKKIFDDLFSNAGN